MANTSTWKNDESETAERLTEAWQTVERFDHKCKRIPLSGSNNRRTDGSKHRGDVSLPDEINALIECKRRQKMAHQTLLEAAKKDAEKHGVNPEHTILITKVLRQRGFTAIIDAELLYKLLSLPGALEIFTKEPVKNSDRHSPNALKSRRSSTSKREAQTQDNYEDNTRDSEKST